MNKLRKTDYVIIAVILALIAFIVFMVTRGGKEEKPKNINNSTSQASVTQEPKNLTYRDYNGKKIGILTGTNMEAESFKYFPDSEYLYFDGYPNLNTALMNGSIDAYLGDEPALKSIHAEQPSIDYIKGRLTNNKYSFAFRKNEDNETKLCDQLNEFLTKCRADGTLAEIDSIWFGSDDSKKLVDMSGLTGENGTIHIVTTSTDEPFSYIKNGAHVGYDIDVTVRFCREYGYALEIGDVDFQARIPALASGKYEFTTSMNVTPEREEEVMFSDPVSEGGIVVAVRASDLEGTASAPAEAASEPSYTEFNGRRIGIRVGSSTEPICFRVFPDSEYFYFDNTSDLDAALQNNKIDAYLTDEPVAAMIHLEQNDVDYIKERVINDDYYFAFQKNTERSNKLRSEFNEVVAELKSQGELDKMKEKWLNSDESVKTYDDTGLTGENGTLTVAVLPDNPPFSYTANNKLQGYAVELSTIFARKKGYRLVFEQANLASCIAGVSSGKYDILAYCLSYTEERAESLDYSDCIYNGGIVLMARTADIENNEAVSSAAASAPAGAASGEPTYTEYNGRKIGIKPGSSFEPITFEYFPDSEYFYFEATGDIIAALQNKKIDGYLTDEASAVLMHAAQSDIDYLKKPIMSEENYFLFQKDTERSNKLLAQFNELLAELKSSGQLDAMKDKWLSGDESEKTVDKSGLTGENGEITVGILTDSVPFSYIMNNELVGYAIEITTLYARKYGYSIKYEQTNLSGSLAGMSAGKYDMLAGDYSYTEERAQSMAFSDAIFDGGIVLMVRSADLTAASADGSADETVEDTSFFGSIKESFNKNFVREDRYKLILEGIRTTCIITVLTVIIGSVLAFLICLFRRADSLLAGKICDLYVKLLQGTPMVVLLMILYYVIFGKSGIAAMWVAVLGFSLNFGAYVSEILRSGIDSIDGGQREAALALGYTENQAFFRFIFPQAAVRQLPVYRGEIISLLKNTSIVGYIAIQDLTKMSDIIRSRTYEAFFPLIVTAVIYFILAWIISLILKLVLKQIDPRSKKRGVKGVATK